MLSRLIDRRGPTVVLVPCAAGPARHQRSARRCCRPIHRRSCSWPPARWSAPRYRRSRRPHARCGRPWSTTQPRSKSAYAVDATFQELIFIVGPAARGGHAGLGRYRSRDHRRRRPRQRGRLDLRHQRCSHGPGEARPQPKRGRTKRCTRPASGCWSSTMFCLIGGFAATEVALIAAARAAGSAGASGPLLAAWSLGSMLAGFVYGSRSWTSAPVVRVTALLGVAAVADPGRSHPAQPDRRSARSSPSAAPAAPRRSHRFTARRST